MKDFWLVTSYLAVTLFGFMIGRNTVVVECPKEQTIIVKHVKEPVSEQ